MNNHKKQNSQIMAEAESKVADLLPYMKAAKDQFPTKEALFAEIHQDRNSRQKLVKTTQCALTLVFCGLGIWAVNPTVSSDTYSTAYAVNEQFTLLDGSHIHLNSNSRLVAKYRLFSREMYLERGEVSFNVVHGLRPFVVAVNASKVRDIGTTFNIAKWNQHFITTVLAGEVELQTGDAKHRLTAGQSMQVSPGRVGLPYMANMEMVTAWQAGKILFNKTPLKDAVAHMQRYRKAPIHLDPGVENMRMTGIYDVTKIEPLLESMDAMFPVKITRLNGGEIKIQKK